MRYKTLLASLFVGSALMANPYESKQEEIASVIETGKKSSMDMIKKLGGKLKHHLKTEGPLGAVKFCSENAYPMTDKLSEELGANVSIKRISLRYRNPGNKPSTAQEQAILESLQTLKANNAMLPEYIVEQVDADTYNYYKPLTINHDVCLKCHGDVSKNPELAAFLKAHYPDDQATGHKPNDLRGAIVVTIKK